MVPICAGGPLSAEAFASIRTAMCLHHAKWDPQVGDVATLSPFPLILNRCVWQQLAAWAEALTAELAHAEREVLASPAMMKTISIPRAFRQRLRSSPDAPRVMRCDFHPTADGWRISEVNADVPGGFSESSALPAMMASHYGSVEPAGNPLERVCDLIERTAGASRDGVVALVAAPGFMEDWQVISLIDKCVASRGIRTSLCAPDNIRWTDDGHPLLWDRPVSLIYRFVQAEWLPSLTRYWRRWFNCAVPMINPLSAMVSESKRLPLVFDRLVSSTTTWRMLLPPTHHPRTVRWRDEQWLVKPAYGNTGDDVASIAWAVPREWRRVCRRVMFSPSQWVAQKRFHTMSIQTPAGERYPCVGVYTIDGRAAGIYGRLSSTPIIDFQATDVAVLIER